MKETWLLRKAGISMKQIGYLLAANVGYALALNLFYVNNNIAAGGLAGIGTVLNYFLSVPVGRYYQRKKVCYHLCDYSRCLFTDCRYIVLFTMSD